ncbi:MAG: fibronectin type III domain-containing protein [Bacteroidetes bacterium]|nr:fibronectin type III domain-containing protein [Bacteroidota bacterium]
MKQFNSLLKSTLLILLLGLSFVSSGQVSLYTFTSSNTPYVPIVGGISIGTEVNDDNTFNNLPIGFNFCYNGVIYDRFSINNNGFIALGPAVTSSYTNISTGTNNNAIHLFNADLQSQAGIGELRYQTIGVAPNRTLVVQYKGYRGYLSSGDTLNGQIRINETLNTIELHYGSCAMGPTSRQAEVGLKGIGNLDYNNRSVIAGIDTWATSTAGVSNAAKCDLQTASVPVSGTKYSWAPPVAPAAPTSLTFTGVTTNGMTVNWVDNSTDETNFYVLRSTDNVNFTLVGTVASVTTGTTGSPYALVQTGLNNNTLYYFRIVSASPAICSAPLTGSQSTLPGTFCGVYTVGPTGAYTSLTAAFAAVATNGVNCPLIFELQAAYVSTVETFPIVVPSLGSSNINTITVRPELGATNLSITSAALNTIQFSGASWITFDGRPGGVGIVRHLTISNTITTGSAVSYINDANNITLNYLNILGVTSSATNGVVAFGNSLTTAGNSDNTIQNCDLSDGVTTPNNMIYSNNATLNAFNARNTINNNTISDFFSPTLASNGVLINTAGNREWTISNNSFFQSANRTYTTSASHSYININSAAGYGYTVNGNFLGGTAPLAAGGPATYLGAVASTMKVILLSVGVGPTSTINNNTIKNFNFSTTSSATVGPGIWTGINILGVGNFDVTNNTIGSTVTNGSIVTSTTLSGGSTTGFTSTCSGNTNITGNNIGGITANSSTNLISTSVIGMYMTAGRNMVTNNTIGSISSADNIINSLNTSATAGLVNGIWSTSAHTSSFTGNTISNLTSQYSGAATTAQVRGITTTSGLNTISQNIISNLKTSAPNASVDLNASVIGISHSSTTVGLAQNISNNIISNLSNITPTAAVNLTGIYFTGSATTFNHTISRNKISNIGSTSSGLAVISGMNILGGTSTYSNNMIALGLDNLGAPYVNGHEYNGIKKNGAVANNFYFNSVNITGANVVAGVAGNTAAFRRTATGVDNVKNNIFANTRSNSTGTGVHYAINLNATTTLTSNRNNFYSTGTGSVFGIVGVTTSANLSAWQVANALDANSFAVDPSFVSATDLHILVTPPVESSLESKGEVIAGIAIDYDNQVRPGPIPSLNGGGVLPDIGADEFDGFPVNTDMAAINIAAPIASGCKTANETVTVVIQNVSAVTIDFALKPVTITCSVSGPNPQVFAPVVLNSGTLAGLATQNVVINLAGYDMTLPGTYVFNASTSVIGDGVPSNDAMGAVSINNNPGTASGVLNAICAFTSTNLTLTNSIPGASIQWQSSPDGLAPWTNIPGANTPISSVVPTDTTYYRAEVCGTYYSNIIVINAQVILPPTTSPVTRCGAGPVTLVATDTNLTGTKWFDVPTGGAPLFNGGIFNTNVVANDTFYVSNSSGANGAQHTTTFAAGNGSSGNAFTVKALTTLTITGFDGHTNNTTPGIWEVWYRPDDYLLIPGSQTSNVGWTQLIATGTIPALGTGLATPITNALSVTIPAGQTYSFQIFRPAGGVAYTNGTVLGALYNANPDMEVYQGHGGTGFAGMTISPRVWNGNIKYSTGCESARIPAIVTVTTPPAITLTANPPVGICVGSSSIFNVTSPNDPNYNYSWQNAATLSSPTGATVTATPTTATTYTVTATDIGSGCVNTATVSLSVNPLPIVSASAPSTPVCPGDPVALSGNATNASAAQIGTGVLQNTTTTYPAPYGNWYWGARHQFLVLASELTAGGLTAGPINDVTFSVASLGSPNPALTGFEIQMAPTALNALPLAFANIGFTVVAPATNYTPIVGANTHTFSNPFIWDGVSNIIVQTCFNNASFTENSVFNQTATPFASSIWLNQDAPGVCAGAAIGTANQRPNMLFSGNPGYTYTYAWTPSLGVANPTAANTTVNAPLATTVYTLTATNATFGCIGTDTALVTVNPVVTGSASVSPTPICLGGSATFIGSVPTNCPGGSVANFAGAYAPANWTLTQVNSNGTVNIAGAPLNIILTSGTNASGIEGSTNYTKTIDCAGTVSFNWSYTHPDALLGSVFDYPRLKLNGNYVVPVTGEFPGFIIALAGPQNGTVTLPVNAGDVIELQAYTIDNDPTPCTVTITNFSAPAPQVGGTVTYWDAPTGGTNLGAPPIPVTPAVAGPLTYYAEYTALGSGCVNPVRDVVTLTVNSLPTVGASASPAIICESSSSTLTGSGAATYGWEPGALVGNPSVTPSVTTTYTVTGTDGNGCTGTATTSVTVISTPAPSPVTATPSTICLGDLSDLNAISVGNTINWFTVPSGGVSLGSTASGVNFPVTPGVTTTYYAESVNPGGGPGGSQTFNYTGSIQTFTVPAGVTSITMEARGAQGGSINVNCVASGGLGARMIGDVAVTPGEVISVLVGQQGFTNGADAGGGGGSFVVRTGNIPLVVAGGGGGASNNIGNCGVNLAGGPGLTTLDGGASGSGMVAGGINGNGGGANFGSGGGGGGFFTDGIAGSGLANNNGKSYLNGGIGGTGNNNDFGGYGGGGAGWFTGGNGGGGGGYSGGGTDGNYPTVQFAGGGGGGSYNIGANQSNTAGFQSGDGLVIFTWSGGGLSCPSVVRTPVTVTVNPTPVINATATPSTTCNLTSVNPCATGAVTYVWTGGLTNCTSFVATTTDTYTVTGTDGAGCTGTSSVTVTVTPASGVLAPTTSNQSQDHGDDFNINYYAANCDLIATVDDGAGGNVLGLTTSTVNVDATASFHNGQPFVRRWYQITPTTNGSADVKLYINQTDFDDYNAAVVAPYLPLPTGPGDASGIANIRITKNDDGGLGNNPIVITPAVSWNGTYWELSFNTPSFSQFQSTQCEPRQCTITCNGNQLPAVLNWKVQTS